MRSNESFEWHSQVRGHSNNCDARFTHVLYDQVVSGLAFLVLM